MLRYRVEVVEPTSLLPRGGSSRETFDAAWSQLGVCAEHWHRAVRLDQDGGLFLKGLYVRPNPNVQHFLRRWHVRNEFDNLRALRDLPVDIPVVLAWGCESRFGLPVRSFLVQREIPDALDFAQYIRLEKDVAARRRVFTAVGEAVGALHASGFIHGDLACRNLMVLGRDENVTFVDLARVKPADGTRLDWRRRKELYRLVKSADKCGASDEEVALMITAAVGAEAPDVIAATRGLRSIHRRGARKWRTWWWRLSGRTGPR